MTQNLYLGSDLDFVFSSGTTNLLEAVDQIWASVVATDFNARAKVLADGIQAAAPDTAGPDIIGLQEVSLWRTQTPGDHLLVPNATTVAYDFLDILSRELAARGLSYRVVASHQNGDIELPGTTGTDYRLTDRDVILAKESIPVTSTSSGTFPHLGTLELPNPIPGGPAIQATVPRGWVAAEFRSGGKTIRYLNTHLEAFSADVASQQVLDLLAVASPTTQPTIVAGDMNLPPGSAGYAQFVTPDTGLGDAWSAVHDGDAGLTCCWNPDLRSGAYDKRIDLVFSTREVRLTSALVVNDTARTPGGLAPSDHAGVVVELTTAAPAAGAALASVGR